VPRTCTTAPTRMCGRSRCRRSASPTLSACHVLVPTPALRACLRSAQAARCDGIGRFVRVHIETHEMAHTHYGTAPQHLALCEVEARAAASSHAPQAPRVGCEWAKVYGEGEVAVTSDSAAVPVGEAAAAASGGIDPLPVALPTQPRRLSRTGAQRRPSPDTAGGSAAGDGQLARHGYLVLVAALVACVGLAVFRRRRSRSRQSIV
jgi:hypothetical protein